MIATHIDRANGHHLLFVESRAGGALYYDLTKSAMTYIQDGFVRLYGYEVV